MGKRAVTVALQREKKHMNSQTRAGELFHAKAESVLSYKKLVTIS